MNQRIDMSDSDYTIPAPPPRRSNGVIGLIVIIALFAVIAYAARQALGPTTALADWGHDWDQAIDSAAGSGKPMLVLFTADWCNPCQELKRDVLTASDVAPILKRDFTLLKIDLTEQTGPNAKLAAGYGVNSIPTLIVFNSKGRQVGRVSGLGEKSDMVKWFETMREKAK